MTHPPGRLRLATLPLLLAASLAVAKAQDAPPLDLYLEVFVNGTSTELVGHFRQEADGVFTVASEELRDVGIRPDPAASAGGDRVRLDALPGVSFAYDAAAQTISFETGDDGRAARVVDAAGRPKIDASAAMPEPEAGFGALMNYSLVASTATGDFADIWALDGLSALLEPRFYSPYGVLDHAMLLNGGREGFEDTIRLGTTFSWSSVGDMRTLRIGDLVTGGLAWTRPVRLGGVQIQSDFGLRPDLVTFPVPSFSGTAAVPSTVDVFVDNARRYSGAVPAGPFEIANLPVVEGGATARVVVRDAQGFETVSQTPFFASSQLLAPGLLDYSAEIGLARRFYGLRSNDYDERPMGVGTLRYGVDERLTLEGHAEGGSGLLNAGAGLVTSLGTFGVGSLAGAASTSDAGTGFLVAAQVQAEIAGLRFNARTQRTFGDYDDVASVTAGDDLFAAVPSLLLTRRPPREIDQIGLALPLGADLSSLSLSFTRLRTDFEDAAAIAGLSYSRPIGPSATLFASGFSSLDGRESGVFAGLSVSLGPRHNASLAGTSDDAGIGGAVELARSQGREIGDYGWRLRAGSQTTSSAAVSYNASPARLDAQIDSFEGSVRASARAEGAIVAAGARPRFTRRIDDAFAIVDVGVPDVEIFHENRPIGRTGADGRIVVPDLRSNERNDLSFDPTGLPLDMAISATRRTLTPARRAGARVDFGLEAGGHAALVSFRDRNGGFLPAGSIGHRADGSTFLVGYDGQAFVEALEPDNAVRIEVPDGSICLARFAFRRTDGQTTIHDVTCEPSGETR